MNASRTFSTHLSFLDWTIFLCIVFQELVTQVSNGRVIYDVPHVSLLLLIINIMIVIMLDISVTLMNGTKSKKKKKKYHKLYVILHFYKPN